MKEETIFTLKRCCLKEDAIVPIYGMELDLFTPEFSLKKQWKAQNAKELCTILNHELEGQNVFSYQLEPDTKLDSYMKDHDIIFWGFSSQENCHGFFNDQKEDSILYGKNVFSLMQKAETQVEKTLRKER